MAAGGGACEAFLIMSAGKVQEASIKKEAEEEEKCIERGGERVRKLYRQQRLFREEQSAGPELLAAVINRSIRKNCRS